MLEFTLEELIVRTGVSRRNIKYWTALYALPHRRDGRRNFYPPITEQLLKGISLLSAHPIFTTAYIHWLIDAVLERPPADPDRAIALRSGWATLDSAFGTTGLLPPGLPEFLMTVATPTPRQPEFPRPMESPFVSNHSRPRKHDDDSLL